MKRPEPKTQYLNEVPELLEKKKKSGYWADMVDEFAERPEKCMTLEYGHTNYSSSAAATIKQRITKDGLKMRVVRNDCTVYVIKEGDDEAEAR